MIVLSPPEASGELIGRNDEMAQVDAALGRVRESGGALLVRGEPGIGKSHNCAGPSSRGATKQPDE